MKIYQVARIMLVSWMTITSCTKKDIQPEPIGEAVPYPAAVTTTIEKAVDSLPYAIWKAAWNRSNIRTIIKNKGAANQTLFLPTDRAFQEAGWTLEKINTASVSELDDLLSYHIVAGKYLRATLASVKGNLTLNSMLTSSELPGTSTYAPFRYKLYVGLYKDSIWIDGQAVCPSAATIEVVNGVIYPIKQIIKRPTQSLYEYLSSDSRFSLYMEVISYMQLAYMDNGAWGIDYETPMMDLSRGFACTFFAPTNEAFRKSGFNNMDDVIAYINKSLPLGEAGYDQNNYYTQPLFSMDSILVEHGLNVFSNAATYDYPFDAAWYTNDLLQNGDKLSGIVLVAGQLYNTPPTQVLLEYPNNNGQPQVKRIGSSHAPLPLAEANVKLLNAVVHVVDDGLLIP